MATHASRRTDKTGKYFEYFIEYLLSKKGYNVDEQVTIGLRPTGGNHNVDLVVSDWDGTEEQELVSLKYQDVAGTAEEKIPYEIMCLQDAVNSGRYVSALIVLAGKGWQHADSYINGAFNKFMNCPDVQVIDYDTFVERYQLRPCQLH